MGVEGGRDRFGEATVLTISGAFLFIYLFGSGIRFPNHAAGHETTFSEF